jgi:DNA-binding transcriptional regulator PaaX
MSKYKYYFRKPKSEISKDILKLLLVSGMVYIAGNSPYFTLNLIKKLKKLNNYKRKKVYDAFYRLRKDGCIEIKRRGYNIHIVLTEKGRKKANWMQIDELKIKKPKRWDKKWRIVMFDISQLKNFYRDIFRGKLKELGFSPLQKSVWICPYKCKDEIDLLKDFLGLTDKEVRLVVSSDIGEDDLFIKKFRI